MIKKTAISLLLLSVVFMTACGGDGSVQQPEEGEDHIGENYAALRQVVSSFDAMTSGTLQIVIDYNQKHVEVGGQGGSEYNSIETKTIDFVKSGPGYHFIEIVEAEDQNVPKGYKQEDGVYTMYHYEAYQDGTFQWVEGAAELGYYDLPSEASVFIELADEALIDDIQITEEDDYTQYTLALDEMFFDYAVQSSDLNSYELKEYVISYFVDAENQLRRVALKKSEYWVQSETYDVEQTTAYDIALTAKNQKINLDYFKENGTHIKPVYDDVTQIWREEFINIPETYILDVRVPKLKETLPNAEKINQKIAVDCAVALNSDVDDLISEGEWGSYPWHTVDFAVYQFGDVYQICIFNTEASAWGSGIGMWMYKYYYDIGVGDVVNQEDFLREMNYTHEEIVEIFHRDYLSEIDMGDSYTYDEISDWYYFDEAGHVQFYVNLFS